MTTPSRVPVRRPRLVAALLASALLCAACAGNLSDDDILAMSEVTVEATTDASTSPADSATAGVPTAADGSTGTVVSGADPDGATDESPVATAANQPAEAGPDAGTDDGASTAAASTPGETGPIVIASVGNYSGPAGAAQAGIPRGVQLWAAAVNAQGGLFGREVQVIVQDDGGDPARYLSAVRDLVENRDVVAFVGQGASLSMQAGTAYLESAKIPVVGSDCSRSEWFSSSIYFPQCPRFDDLIRGQIESGLQLTGKTRFGFVYCSEAASCTDGLPVTEAGFRDNPTAELVYLDSISLTQVDFTAECRAAASNGVEVMTVAADPNALSRFVRSCERQGFRPQYVQPSISIGPDSVTRPGLEKVAATLPVFPFADVSGGAFDEYNRAVDSFGGGQTGPAVAFGWASAKLFELGATRAALATESLQPDTLATGLRTIKGETLGGLTTSLDFTGRVPNPAPCYFIVQGDGAGGWMAPKGPDAQC